MNTHPIVHVDLPVNDVKKESSFYKEALGWNIHTDTTFDYTMFQAEGGPGGGFVTVGTENMKIGQPLIYLGTSDIAESLQKIEAHGGKVVKPKTEIPDVGWFAVFQDTCGNCMALFTPMGKMK